MEQAGSPSTGQRDGDRKRKKGRRVEAWRQREIERERGRWRKGKTMRSRIGARWRDTETNEEREKEDILGQIEFNEEINNRYLAKYHNILHTLTFQTQRTIRSWKLLCWGGSQSHFSDRNLQKSRKLDRRSLWKNKQEWSGWVSKLINLKNHKNVNCNLLPWAPN